MAASPRWGKEYLEGFESVQTGFPMWEKPYGLPMGAAASALNGLRRQFVPMPGGTNWGVLEGWKNRFGTPTPQPRGASQYTKKGASDVRVALTNTRLITRSTQHGVQHAIWNSHFVHLSVHTFRSVLSFSYRVFVLYFPFLYLLFFIVTFLLL